MPLPACLSACLPPVTQTNSDLCLIYRLPRSSTCYVYIYLQLCLSFCHTHCACQEMRPDSPKQTRCLPRTTSFCRHGKSGTFELTIEWKKTAFTHLNVYVCSTLTFPSGLFVHVFGNGCISLCCPVCVFALVKGRWNFSVSDWDLSETMNRPHPGAVTVWSQTRSPEASPLKVSLKPQSKSMKKRKWEGKSLMFETITPCFLMQKREDDGEKS